MSILGKYSDNYLEEEPIKKSTTSSYTPPAVLRKDEDDSLKKSLVISTILHPTVVGAAWLIFLILAALGIHLAIFERPKPKMNDIEFVLVEKEAKPINPNTPYRSDRDSRAGGHHDPTRKVSMPSPAPAQAQKPSPAPSPKPAAKKPAPQKVQQPKKTVTKTPTPAPVQKPAAKPAKTEAPVPKGPAKIAPPKPAPPTARPSIKPPSTPKPVAKPSSAFTVPVPKGGTKPGAYATGPISGSGKSSSASGGGGRSTYAPTPTPSLAPTGGGSSSGTKLAKGGGGGSGALGNPGPGNPNGAPGIDTIREPDFGPYMRELQRRIKMNWDPPKGNESKRVVLLFQIARDGRLLSCRVFKSSGLPSADKAAINAVQATAPFKPLPAEFKGPNIDIQFTFDYNVFGASGYN